MLVEALDQESSVECCRLLVPLQRWIPWQAKNIDTLTNRGYGYPVKPGMTDRLLLCHPRPDRGSMAKVLATLSDAILQIALLYQNCPLLRLRLVGGLKSLGLS
jgi:hypothetical protein